MGDGGYHDGSTARPRPGLLVLSRLSLNVQLLWSKLLDVEDRVHAENLGISQAGSRASAHDSETQRDGAKPLPLWMSQSS